VRVIAGIAKGHKLQTPEGLSTRPTTDRMKETLFNILAFDLPSAKFLDLFAGSGGIGIEALSRGARQAVFVENEPIAIQVINGNLEHTKFLDQGEIIKKDVLEALSLLQQRKEKFDMIFMDPPYESAPLARVLRGIVDGDLLEKSGMIIVERSPKTAMPFVEGLCIRREKEYRTTVMTFLSLED